MITVFVKHYFTEAGGKYYDEELYPHVEKVASGYEGFVSLDLFKDPSDKSCRNITLKFENSELLNKWIETKDHVDIIAAMEPLRTRSWFYVFVEGDHDDAPTDMSEWNEVPLAESAGA